jgi:phenol 2-monooxygenase
MNVSMQDGFNLGWKVASVLLGTCSPDILHSYSAERQRVASELIDFDRQFARMFSARPTGADAPDGDGVDPAEFQRYFVSQGRFTAGTATRYAPSILTAEPAWQHLAQGFVLGMRFHSAPVVRLADARSVHLGHTVKADGRWRVFLFASGNDQGSAGSGVRTLCEFLADSPRSPVRTHTPDRRDVDSVIDVRAVFQQGHRELDIEAMPPLLVPRKGRYGLRDYEKVFCADSKTGSDVFEMRRIDRQRGCIVVVRPDQHVANILPLDAHDELAAFFARFMVPQQRFVA